MNNNYNEEYAKNCECVGESMDIIKLIEYLPPHTKISNLCTEVINEGDSSSPRMFSFTISGVVVCDDEDDDWDDWDDDDDNDWGYDDDDCWDSEYMRKTTDTNQAEAIKNVIKEADESL